MLCLVPLTILNYKDLAKPGKRIVYDHGYLIIQDDLTLGGMSVKNFIERFSYEDIYIISDI